MSESEPIDDFVAFRLDYLAGISEVIDGVEAKILQITEETLTEVSFEIAREVHSIKGSAGSYGYPFITSICHQFEDDTSANSLRLDKDRDHFLKYIDLIRKVIDCVKVGGYEESAYERQLSDLKSNFYKVKSQDFKKVLFADNSKTTHSVLVHTLKNEQVKISHVNNGFTALGRLLRENFDLFICSKNLEELNGNAVIAALSQETTKVKTEIIMLTSKDISTGVQLQDAKVRAVVKRDEHFSDNLLRAVTDSIKGVA